MKKSETFETMPKNRNHATADATDRREKLQIILKIDHFGCGSRRSEESPAKKIEVYTFNEFSKAIFPFPRLGEMHSLFPLAKALCSESLQYVIACIATSLQF